jgi:hypothetical protein
MTQFHQDGSNQRSTNLRRISDKDEFDPIGWVERGYVRARFGGMPVLLTPELAKQIRDFREKQP